MLGNLFFFILVVIQINNNIMIIKTLKSKLFKWRTKNF